MQYLHNFNYFKKEVQNRLAGQGEKITEKVEEGNRRGERKNKCAASINQKPACIFEEIRKPEEEAHEEGSDKV